MRDLAREGDDIGDTGPVELQTVASEAWASVATDGATLAVEASTTVEADHARLRQLLTNLFENAVEHGSTSLAPQTRQDAVEHGSTNDVTQSDDGGEHTSVSGREQSVAGTDGNPESAGALTVTVGTVDGGFYVEDDGQGVPPSVRDDIFEQGYTTVEDNTGLGLAIIRRIVDGHGWEITVGDGTDGGARFEIHTA